MEQKRIKVRLTENSPYSDYGYYEKGDIGYIDGYVNGNAVIILENGKFAKADLRWIEAVNEEDKNVNTGLKDGEDEKIRKAIGYAIGQSTHFDGTLINGVYPEEALAWIERQCEKGANGNEREIPNSAWSEEEEEEFQIAIDTLAKAGQHDSAHWLKSIKERVQPKQEWSEEQLKLLNELMSFLLTDCPKQWAKYGELLKSIKPQNTWKPSGRELGAILAAIGDEKQKGSDVAKELLNIYQQLKKLKN